MIPARIVGATRVLKAPPDWNEARDGKCSALAIRDSQYGDMPVMTSAWTPTPEELELLNKGASVHVGIIGRSHPPLFVTTGSTPDEIEPTT